MQLREIVRRGNFKTTFILASVTVLYTVFRYEGSAGFFLNFLSRAPQAEASRELAVHYQRAAAFLALGLVPMLIARFVFGERLREYGLGLARPGFASLFSLLGVLFLFPFTFFGGRNPELAAVYPQIGNIGDSAALFLRSAASSFVYYVGYEFCFRGFLFMGTREDLGDLRALGVSLLASVLLHVDRPQPEMIMSILAGVAFPLLAKKFTSIWPGVVIHAYAGISLDYWVVMNRALR